LGPTVCSSNAGRWPGYCEPAGQTMRAMLSAVVSELTRPMYSSMRLDLVPAASMMLGFEILVGMIDPLFVERSQDAEQKTEAGCRTTKVGTRNPVSDER